MKANIIDELSAVDILCALADNQIRLEKRIKRIEFCLALYYGPKIYKFVKKAIQMNKKTETKSHSVQEEIYVEE